MEIWIEVFGTLEKVHCFFVGIVICFFIQLVSYPIQGLGDLLASWIRGFIRSDKEAKR